MSPRWPCHDNSLRTHRHAQTCQDAAFAGGEITSTAVDKADLPAAVILDGDTGADGISVTVFAVTDQFQLEPVVGSVGFVVQKGYRASDVAVSQIRTSVVIVVGPGEAAPNVALPEIRPGLVGHV